MKVRNEIFNLRKQSNFWVEIELIADHISPIIEINADECAIEPHDEELLLHVLPELLCNAAQHSGATQIYLSFSQENNHCVVTIGDNGIGGAKITENRYGLLGCVERVQSHGALISIETGTKGTTVTITL